MVRVKSGRLPVRSHHPVASGSFESLSEEPGASGGTSTLHPPLPLHQVPALAASKPVSGSLVEAVKAGMAAASRAPGAISSAPAPQAQSSKEAASSVGHVASTNPSPDIATHILKAADLTKQAPHVTAAARPPPAANPATSLLPAAATLGANGQQHQPGDSRNIGLRPSNSAGQPQISERPASGQQSSKAGNPRLVPRVPAGAASSAANSAGDQQLGRGSSMDDEDQEYEEQEYAQDDDAQHYYDDEEEEEEEEEEDAGDYEEGEEEEEGDGEEYMRPDSRSSLLQAPQRRSSLVAQELRHLLQGGQPGRAGRTTDSRPQRTASRTVPIDDDQDEVEGSPGSSSAGEQGSDGADGGAAGARPRAQLAEGVPCTVPVICNGNRGTFLVAKQSMVCRCRTCEARAAAKNLPYTEMTPTEFERHSGMAASKKWKYTVRIDDGKECGMTIGAWLEDRGILQKFNRARNSASRKGRFVRPVFGPGASPLKPHQPSSRPGSGEGGHGTMSAPAPHGGGHPLGLPPLTTSERMGLQRGKGRWGGRARMRGRGRGRGRPALLDENGNPVSAKRWLQSTPEADKAGKEHRLPQLRVGPQYQAEIPTKVGTAPVKEEAPDVREGVPGPSEAEAIALAGGVEKAAADAMPADAVQDIVLPGPRARDLVPELLERGARVKRKPGWLSNMVDPQLAAPARSVSLGNEEEEDSEAMESMRATSLATKEASDGGEQPFRFERYPGSHKRPREDAPRFGREEEVWGGGRERVEGKRLKLLQDLDGGRGRAGPGLVPRALGASPHLHPQSSLNRALHSHRSSGISGLADSVDVSPGEVGPMSPSAPPQVVQWKLVDGGGMMVVSIMHAGRTYTGPLTQVRRAKKGRAPPPPQAQAPAPPQAIADRRTHSLPHHLISQHGTQRSEPVRAKQEYRYEAGPAGGLTPSPSLPSPATHTNRQQSHHQPQPQQQQQGQQQQQQQYRAASAQPRKPSLHRWTPVDPKERAQYEAARAAAEEEQGLSRDIGEQAGVLRAGAGTAGNPQRRAQAEQEFMRLESQGAAPPGARCGLCHQEEEDEPVSPAPAVAMARRKQGLGKLMLVRVSAITHAWVHDQCARWSPEVYKDPQSSQLLGVPEAVRRGRMLKCRLCGDKGATLGCHVSSCRSSFHLPCARFHHCHLQAEPYQVTCPQHKEALGLAAVEDRQQQRQQQVVQEERVAASPFSDGGRMEAAGALHKLSNGGIPHGKRLALNFPDDEDEDEGASPQASGPAGDDADGGGGGGSPNAGLARLGLPEQMDPEQPFTELDEELQDVLGGTIGRSVHRPGRCAVCVIQRKGKCGTESAPKRCLRRQAFLKAKAARGGRPAPAGGGLSRQGSHPRPALPTYVPQQRRTVDLNQPTSTSEASVDPDAYDPGADGSGEEWEYEEDYAAQHHGGDPARADSASRRAMVSGPIMSFPKRQRS